MTKDDLINYKRKISQLSEKEKRLRDLELRKYAKGELQGPPVGYPSIDKPWLKYYNHDIEHAELPNESIYQFVRNSNKDNLNKVAIELRTSSNDFGHGFKMSYKEFFRKVEKTASAFKTMGVKPNDIVAMILPNLPESRIMIYALSMIGATAYPINFMMPVKNVETIIEENNIKKFAIFSAFYDKYKEVLKSDNLEDVIYLTGTESLPTPLKFVANIKNKTNIPNNKKIITYDKFVTKGTNEKIEPYYEDNHIAIIVGTSGTTGIPKGVCLTDKNLNAIAMELKYTDSFKKGTVFLDALIQSIGYGLTAMHCETYIGLHAILIPELVTDKIGKVLAKTKPNSFSGGPVHCINIARSEEYREGKIPKLDNFMCGGATLDKNLEKKVNHVEENYYENGVTNPDILVRQGLGATENGGSGTYAVQGSYKFGSVGIPLPLVTFGVFEMGTDNELGTGEQGELCITGPTVMKYYLNNEEETKKVLKKHSDGTCWLHLADIGYIDEDGQVYHVDRVKNLFMRTGFNIHPNKIKEYLNTLPMINNCEVVGVEHPDEQTVPVAFIEVNEAYKHFSYDNLIQMIHNECYHNIDELYIPYDWYIVDKLPMNLGGKVDKKILLNEANIDYSLRSKDIGTKHLTLSR